MIKSHIITLTLSLFFVIGCVNNSNNNENFKKVVQSFTNKENNFSNTFNRLSEDYILSELSKVKNDLKELRSVDFKNLLKEEKVDYKFIESLLVGKELDYEEVQSWKRDPRDYMNFRQVSSNINGPKTCEEKIIFLIEYLPIIKNDLQSGSKQLVEYVPRFQELGLYMAKNSSVIFNVEVKKFLESCNSVSEDNRNQILSFSSQIIDELKVFTNFLENVLPSKEESTFAIGKEIL